MIVRLRRRGAFFRFAVIASLVAFSGCSVKRYPDMTHNPAEMKGYQNRNGVALALDPLIEEDRVRKHFGVDILSKYLYGAGADSRAILPVFMAIENKGDNPVSLRWSEIRFLGADGAVIGAAVGGGEARRPAVQARAGREGSLSVMTMSGLLLPPMFAVVIFYFPFVLIADAADKSAEANILSKTLPEKSLGRGEANKGFVYFAFTDNQIAAVRSASKIRVTVADARTGEDIPFEFGIDSGLLDRRLAELQRRPAEATAPQ